MADQHNQSQSLSNMLHSVTTKLAWRKVNYGPCLCSSAGVAVILYSFCRYFHYANTCCVHFTYNLFFLHTFLFHCQFLHDSVVFFVWRVQCAISRIIKLSINDFYSQTNTLVTQWAAVRDVVHISCVLYPFGPTPCIGVYENHLQFYVCIQLFLSYILGFIYVQIL